MKDFISDRWRPILAHNGLSAFDALWKLEAPWFEEPNHRRGGWSGVSRCELALPGDGSTGIFLKRQENHRARLWTHPVRGAPTFLREFRHGNRVPVGGWQLPRLAARDQRGAQGTHPRQGTRA